MTTKFLIYSNTPWFLSANDCCGDESGDDDDDDDDDDESSFWGVSQLVENILKPFAFFGVESTGAGAATASAAPATASAAPATASAAAFMGSGVSCSSIFLIKLLIVDVILCSSLFFNIKSSK